LKTAAKKKEIKMKREKRTKSRILFKERWPGREMRKVIRKVGRRKKEIPWEGEKKAQRAREREKISKKWIKKTSL
jgi:hypothetical protein